MIVGQDGILRPIGNRPWSCRPASACANVNRMRAFAPWIISAALIICAASAADISGTYKGTWTGGMANGDISMTLRSATDADVSFSAQGQDVKCHVTSVKVDGSKIEIVYDFDLGDTKLQSTATGELKGKTLEGTYKTKSMADGSAVDEGTWKATSS